MDGARFAGAVAGLGASPADLTWRAGVDVMSFGGTKNGCLAAEAVVFFDPAEAEGFAIARQRAGHTFSKSWFVAAQFDAYLDRRPLARSRPRAPTPRRAELADAVAKCREARLAREPDGNEIFAIVLEGPRPSAQGRGRGVSPMVGGKPGTKPSGPIGRSPRPPGRELLASAEDVDRFTAALLGQEMKKGAPKGASFVVERVAGLRGDLGLDLLGLAVGGAVRDLDLAGLRGLGDLADEVDMEEAVLEARALHLDMVGELEAALEGARGDAAIEDLAAFLGGLLSSRP